MSLLAVLALAGCKQTVQTKEAVRQGVVDYLSTRGNLDLKAMQVDVTSVNFRQNEADVVVSFRPKSSPNAEGMEMRYTLEQKGGRWVVKGKADKGAAPHGGMPAEMAAPEGMGAGHGGMTAMPPAEAKPETPASGASKMPPGHPQFGAPRQAPSEPKK